MMVFGIGIDLVQVARVRAELSRDGEDWKRRIFTPAEIADCDGMRRPERHYAARFAAKEAFFKALRTGVPHAGAWRQVEVRRGAEGEAQVALHADSSEAVRAASVSRVLLSMSHTDAWAAASVVLESGETR